MAIVTLQHFITRILLSFGVMALVACGGGGAKKDTTPNSFTITAVQNAAVSTQVESSAITVTGINKPAAISITNGEYAIGGGTFTNVASTVEKNQTVKVRLTTSANTNTAVSATLTIGGVSATFTVTTAPDVTPDAFSFEPNAVVDVEPNTTQTSNSITVNDIDIPVAISITNGEYKIDDGTFTSTAGTISNGQMVSVRVSAPNTTDATETAILTIGGVSTTYSVTTYPDEDAPTATIDFPLPSTATISESITIRGTAADDFNTITSLTVKISSDSPSTVAATSEDGFATWQAVIPLVDGANTLTLITEDSQENINEEAAQVVVHKQAFTAAFPNNDVVITSATAVALDKENNRVFVMDDGASWQLVAVDLATGQRSIFSSPSIPTTQSTTPQPFAMVIDRSRNQLIVAGGAQVDTIALSDGRVAIGTRELLSSDTVPNNSQPTLLAPYGVAIDPTNSNFAYVLGKNSQNLARMNIMTGERTLVSDNNIPDSGASFISPLDVEISANGEYAWVLNSFFNNMLKVDLATGVRTEIGTNGYPETGFPIALKSIVSNTAGTYLWGADIIGGLVKYDVNNNQWSSVWVFDRNVDDEFHAFLDIDEENNYLIFAEKDTKGVYLFDLVNSQYVILSKSGL